MKAKILKLKRSNPDPSKIHIAADAIRKGNLVVFPTETVYGIGADATNASACKKIFKAKKRPSDNPLIVHVSDMKMAEEIAYIPKRYYKTIEKIWPAPITFIMKAKKALPSVVTSGLNTVAVRMPADKIAIRLISESGTPIAAPSANLSKKPSSTSGKHAINYFKKSVGIILDAGPSKFGIESTVLDLLTFTLLRPGAYTLDEITRAFGKKPGLLKETEETSKIKKPRSPGMKYKHYSPETQVLLFEGDTKEMRSILIKYKKRFVFIGSKETASKLSGISKKNIILGRKSDRKSIARNLFRSLIDLDSLGAEFCITESFSEKDYGLAIMNRLRKASGYKYFRTAEDIQNYIK
jgi:L-threonylcarbamoyladenylate synthase